MEPMDLTRVLSMEFACANLQVQKENENPSPAEEGKNVQLKLSHRVPIIEQKDLSIVSCLIICMCIMLAGAASLKLLLARY